MVYINKGRCLQSGRWLWQFVLIVYTKPFSHYVCSIEEHHLPLPPSDCFGFIQGWGAERFVSGGRQAIPSLMCFFRNCWLHHSLDFQWLHLSHVGVCVCCYMVRHVKKQLAFMLDPNPPHFSSPILARYCCDADWLMCTKGCFRDNFSTLSIRQHRRKERPSLGGSMKW